MSQGSFLVVSVELGPKLKCQISVAKLKSACNSFIIDHKGLGYEPTCWKSLAGTGQI